MNPMAASETTRNNVRWPWPRPKTAPWLAVTWKCSQPGMNWYVAECSMDVPARRLKARALVARSIARPTAAVRRKQSHATGEYRAWRGAVGEDSVDDIDWI